MPVAPPHKQGCAYNPHACASPQQAEATTHHPAYCWHSDASSPLPTVSPPVHTHLQAQGERWCADRTGAVDEWVQAVDAGGLSAQIAAATMLFYTCTADKARLWDWLGSALINDARLNEGSGVLRYAEAMVAAFDRSGVDFCVTVVVVNETSSEVVFNRPVHVGPPPSAPEGCLPGLQQAVATCGGSARVDPAPGSPCCAAVEGLGVACRSNLTASTDMTVSMPL